MAETEDGGAKQAIEPNQSHTAAPSGEGAEHVVKPAVAAGAITAALASAGHTLGGAEVELVLNPLRLAFETKNLKILEPALDCLHVCNYKLLSSSNFSKIIFPTRNHCQISRVAIFSLVANSMAVYYYY